MWMLTTRLRTTTFFWNSFSAKSRIVSSKSSLVRFSGPSHPSLFPYLSSHFSVLHQEWIPSWHFYFCLRSQALQLWSPSYWLFTAGKLFPLPSLSQWQRTGAGMKVTLTPGPVAWVNRQHIYVSPSSVQQKTWKTFLLNTNHFLWHLLSFPGRFPILANIPSESISWPTFLALTQLIFLPPQS